MRYSNVILPIIGDGFLRVKSTNKRENVNPDWRFIKTSVVAHVYQSRGVYYIMRKKLFVTVMSFNFHVDF